MGDRSGCATVDLEKNADRHAVGSIDSFLQQSSDDYLVVS
jgi:hypothetical protein